MVWSRFWSGAWFIGWKRISAFLLNIVFSGESEIDNLVIYKNQATSFGIGFEGEPIRGCVTV